MGEGREEGEGEEERMEGTREPEWKTAPSPCSNAALRSSQRTHAEFESGSPPQILTPVSHLWFRCHAQATEEARRFQGLT